MKQLPARISLHELGQAMAELDLRSVPPHKRKRALMDHFMRIQEDTITDKNMATQIAISRRLKHAQEQNTTITGIVSDSLRKKS